MDITTPSCPVSLGESFNPLAGEQLENPYPLYEQARNSEPVFFSPGYRMWVHTIARLFDIGDDRVDDLKRWSLSFLHLVSAHLKPARQVQVATEVVEFQLFIRDHIERKRRKPGEDLVSQLIAGGGDEPFSEEELVTQIVGFLMAGHETTTNSIGNALHLLLKERSRWEAIVADRSLIPAAFEEVLRLDTSVPAFLRTATADTVLAGQKISAGDLVLVAYGSANHDAEVFDDPDSFKLDRRYDSPHMGFGAGFLYCVGAPLARLQGRIVLDRLADRLPSLRLPDQELRLCLP